MDGASNSETHLGLVCVTQSGAVRYKTLTRTRYLALEEGRKPQALRALYTNNLEALLGALRFCRAEGIRLYRMPSEVFPLSDWENGVGRAVLGELAEAIGAVGREAERLELRVIAHPDQFVVLNSENPAVVENSRAILENHALIFDLLGLPRTAWACINIHGGKRGRGTELVENIRGLGEGVRSRLTLENDERAYGAAEILEVCRAAGVPMTFDAHHHLVKERLSSYEDPSIAAFVSAARQTWVPPEWQVLHISNGRELLHDIRHHDLVEAMPSSYRQVQWIEVEAKGKEVAIAHLREHWL
ncbi:MAG: hypothetical protein SFU83_08475 [Meiothermus sp.]|nr:hypothetical protein [Meiothermus sp.]